MRWLVEVTSLGTTEKESLHVDAETWQKALHTARAQRGDPGPMSGFSIELLDEGCRAVDPGSRTRYEVRRAAEARTSVAPPAFAPLTPLTQSVPPPPPAPVVPPPAPASVSVAPRPAPHAPAAPAVLAHEPSVIIAPTPPPPPVAAPVIAPAPPPPPIHASPFALPIIPTMPIAVGAAPATLRADVAANVPSQIVFKREQDATEAMPLTYREYVYNVPPSTSEAAAETLLTTQLDFVRASLERVPAGKLVNLAAVDAPLDTKPAPAPLATLTWKDWRGAPVLAFPRRPASPASAVSRPPAQHAPAPAFVSPAAPPFAPAFAPAPVAAQVALAAPAAPVFAAPVFAAPVFAAPAPAAFVPPAPPPPVFVPPQPPPPAPVAAAPAPVSAPPPAPVFAPAFVPPAAAAVPAFAQASAVAFPGSVPVAMPQPFAPAFTPPAPIVRAPPLRTGGPTTNGRVRGEDLIADLFEAMHDLHFLRDALEGGEFCLAQAMDKLPSQAGIVHLYDIDHREFLVTTTRGAGTGALLSRRVPESDPILLSAMRKRKPIVFTDGANEAGAVERYVAIGGARSVIIAPVEQAGRFLGAIEILNPLDGQPFTEAEGNAIMYIADQLAEFVSQRGVVTDPERIAARQLPGT